MAFKIKRGRKASARLSCSAVIAAAGSSDRMAGEDKIFLSICGVPVLAHSLKAFQNSDCIDEIIIVVQEDKIAEAGEICEKYSISKATRIMLGGPTRLESVLNGVLAVSGKKQLIAIHDGARPCVGDEIITGAVHSAAKYHAAAPGIPVSSTLKAASGGIIEKTICRDNLFEIQTPQVFAADLIKAALTNALDKKIDVTDDCMAAEAIGVPVHITEGSRYNIKLTTSEDIVIAEAILKS